MRVIALATLALAAIASPAAAGDQDDKAQRVVYVCDRSEETQRSFERQYGEQRFVTAEDALKAADRNENWNAPRCMTEQEYAKLNREMAARTQPFALSAR